ncbi:MAG: hypothetical protein JWO56_364, partial [Acidobacteria bacterium]|nr:hypothetical protein [Acidobacteriota bacterium]
MTMRRLLLLFVLFVTGCSFFSRTKNNFYSLDRVPPATAVAPAPPGVSALPVAIDALELPPGVDRREIVVRQADHRLDVRSTDQWSAALQPLVLHTLAFDLASRLPEGMVILPGAVRPAGTVRSIDLAFEELTAGPEAKVTLDARWTLRETGRPDLTRHEQIAVDLPSLDSANIATGISRALGTLADRVAAGVGR